MCGICGIVSTNQIRPYKIEHLKEMMSAIKHRGPDQDGTFTSIRALLGHVRLSIMDPENGLQPMTKYDCVKRYTIIYNGELYNSNELREILINLGYKFQSNCDTEVILNAYIQYKERCLELFKGIYAFAIYDGYQLFLARDRMGVKPLFYTQIKDKLIFASEIKALFKIPEVKRTITKEGFIELYGLGPTQTLGKTPYQNIYSLEPGQFLYYSLRGIKKQYYYKIPTKKNTYTFEEAKNIVHDLFSDIVKSQLQSDVGISSLLSGGLDSSIICAIAAKYLKLNTYAIDYKDNDKNFISNNFQRSRDTDYARLMSASISSNHHECIIDSKNLADNLFNSMIARDMPGMADIDSSMYCLAKYIAKDNKVILSGECADEVFGGYPWFYRQEIEDSLFPWHRNIDKRIQLLADKYQNFEYKDYIKNSYLASINNIEYIDDECKEDKEWRKMTYLNIYWFMQNLLHRKDSQTMANGLEARVPFADHELIEFVYNLPKKYKFKEDKEKYLLREAFIDELPYEIVYRKKNPYPKTFDPEYFKLITKNLKLRMENESSIINKLFKKEEIDNIISTPENNIPWFGQLMTTPQLLAYLVQFDQWVDSYHLDLQFLD